MPIGFFVTGINLENVDSAAVTFGLLKDRFHKKSRPNIHERRGQDVPDLDVTVAFRGKKVRPLVLNLSG